MSIKKKLSKSEVFSILDEVESTFAASLKDKRVAKLAKSEEAEEVVIESEEEKDKKKKAKEESKDESKEESKEDGEETMEKSENFEKEVKDLYKSMSKSERDIHLNALNAVLNPVKEEKAETLSKSEILLKEENVALRKSLEEMTDKVTKFISGRTAPSAPAAKAVTEIAYMGKSEASNAVAEVKWDAATINSKLNQLSKSENTSASDRAAINEYYLDGRNVKSIEHLLK